MVLNKILTRYLLLFFLLCTGMFLKAQAASGGPFPVRGFAIAAPSPQLVDSFIIFIHKELAPRKVNTLMLRVDFNFQYKSHPELAQANALSLSDIKKIVTACRQNNIRLIPQVNLLGHQSWASHTGKLLEVYPQFDETPHVKMPAEYKWPNADSLYCKSYCPLHPDVHTVVFALMDEICDAFDSNAFHAGMDEVFYIGDDKCPRCAGKDKAELFAGEVRKLRDHLALNKRELWIWGDRLLDGRATGIGMWEASFNDTHGAIDLIPKDVVICDWHYERPDKTAVYFAMKGFRVITCPWRNPQVTIAQVKDMKAFRNESAPPMSARFYGMMQTVWSGAGGFLNEYYGVQTPTNNTPSNSFRALFEEMDRLEVSKGLKEYFKEYFLVGAAISPRALKTDEAQLILQQFNSITAENAMKMAPIHPSENTYYWQGADSIAAFAKKNGLKMRGHTLVWHSQAPLWLFTDKAGKRVSKAVLLKRLKEHITTVVTRYKDVVYAWDVVNEAISDHPDSFYRNSQFYAIAGEEYIRKAFEYAHAADPHALLFYNDYNETDPVKREKIYKLVKGLKDSGIPIHGIGLQAHYSINEPVYQQLDSTLSRFSELGLNLQITELDISVYPKEHMTSARKASDYNTDFTSVREQQQLEKYKMCFALFRKYKDQLTSVTFWNISDRRSWLDNFPVRGRKDYPLLFDKNLKPKKVYWEVVSLSAF